MINIAKLRRSCRDILKNDAYFTSQVSAILGEDLNYYLGSNEDRAENALPAIVFHTETGNDQESEDRMYSIIFLVQIEGSLESTTIDGDEEYPEEEILGDLAILADETLRRKIPCINVDGVTDLYVSDSNYAIAPITEAMLQEEGDITTLVKEAGYLLTFDMNVTQIKFLNS